MTRNGTTLPARLSRQAWDIHHREHAASGWMLPVLRRMPPHPLTRLRFNGRYSGSAVRCRPGVPGNDCSPCHNDWGLPGVMPSVRQSGALRRGRRARRAFGRDTAAARRVGRLGRDCETVCKILPMGPEMHLPSIAPADAPCLAATGPHASVDMSSGMHDAVGRRNDGRAPASTGQFLSMRRCAFRSSESGLTMPDRNGRYPTCRTLRLDGAEVASISILIIRNEP